MLDAAEDTVRPLLASDLRALERLLEPGDPAWIESAFAMNETRPDERGLRAVLVRVGADALLVWTRRRSIDDIPGIVLEVLAEEALALVLQQGTGALVERILTLTEDENLRECLLADPLNSAIAWQTLASLANPSSCRSRLARVLVAIDHGSTLFALLSVEAEPFASIRSQDRAAVAGAVLRASFPPESDKNAVGIREHSSFVGHLGLVGRRDREWLAAEVDVGEALSWVARTPLLSRREPELVQALIKAWSGRGWPGSAGGDLLSILDKLDSYSRIAAAASVLDAGLRLRRNEDLSVIARTFSLVHEAPLADTRLPFWIFEWFTDDWDKAKKPRRTFLRTWDQMNWPPDPHSSGPSAPGSIFLRLES